jgi:hypothetical protein
MSTYLNDFRGFVDVFIPAPLSCAWGDSVLKFGIIPGLAPS